MTRDTTPLSPNTNVPESGLLADAATTTVQAKDHSAETKGGKAENAGISQNDVAKCQQDEVEPSLQSPEETPSETEEEANNCLIAPCASEEEAPNPEDDAENNLKGGEEEKIPFTTRPKPVLKRCKPVEGTYEERVSFLQTTEIEQSASFSASIEDGVACYMHARMADSPFFQAHSATSLPVLGTDEINLGHLLGEGEFGRVREVIEIANKAGTESISRLLKESRHGSTHHHTNMYGSSYDHYGSTTNHTRSGRIMEGDEDNSDGEDSFCNEEGMGTFAPPSSGTTHHQNQYSSDSSIEFVEIEHAIRARKVLKKRCWRDGKARYAVKQLKEELLLGPAEDDSEEFHMGRIGAMDLAMEAALLSRLSHPNIVKLRATTGIPGRPDYMLVMDRLYSTLDHKIQEWKLEQPTQNIIKQLFGMGGYFGIGRKLTAQKRQEGKDFSRRDKGSTDKSSSKTANRLIRQSQLLHRLYAAYDVARALRYLHQHKIVFRDLKPQNIAFDIRGDVRIFDFGLAKELVEADLAKFPDDYNGTGMTGSPRWMSPEVYFCEPYGLSTDVYSFGLLLWNLCSLQTPFGDNLSLDSLHDKVMVKGQRPKKLRSKLIPKHLKFQIAMCWSKDRGERPTMGEMCDVLRDSISTVKRDLDEAVGREKMTVDEDNPASDTLATAMDSTNATQPATDLSAPFASRGCSHRTASTAASTTYSSPQSSFSRRSNGPFLNLFVASRTNKKKNHVVERPVNVSFHHQPKNKEMPRVNAPALHQRRHSIMGESMKKLRSRFSPKDIHVRNSDLEERSQYLLEKSLRSLDDMGPSSNNLASSGGSRGSFLHRSPCSHRRALFGGGSSMWSIGH